MRLPTSALVAKLVDSNELTTDSDLRLPTSLSDSKWSRRRRVLEWRSEYEVTPL